MQRLLPLGSGGPTAGLDVGRTRSARRTGALLMSVGAIALIGAACVPMAEPPPPPEAPPTVIVYGDSLTTESHQVIIDTIEEARPGTRALVRHFGGTAICDWFDHMEADDQENAQLVVLQFSGNPRPCMGGWPVNSPLWKARYIADADRAVSIWAARDVPVLLIGNPQGPAVLTSQPAHPLDEGYATVAAGYPGIATFSSAAAEALSVDDPLDPPNRFFPYEMDCLPDEGVTEGCTAVAPLVIPVRTSPTDGHLCTGVTGLASACPIYASGVRRFGEAIGLAAAALIP